MQQKDDLALEVKSLQQQIFMIEQQMCPRGNQLTPTREQELAVKDQEIAKLQSELEMMTLRAKQAEGMVIELQAMLMASIIVIVCTSKNYTGYCSLNSKLRPQE